MGACLEVEIDNRKGQRRDKVREEAIGFVGVAERMYWKRANVGR